MSGFEDLICQTHAKRVQQPPSRRDEITQQLAFAALGAGVTTTVAVWPKARTRSRSGHNGVLRCCCGDGGPGALAASQGATHMEPGDIYLLIGLRQ